MPLKIEAEKWNQGLKIPLKKFTMPTLREELDKRDEPATTLSKREVKQTERGRRRRRRTVCFWVVHSNKWVTTTEVKMD